MVQRSQRQVIDEILSDFEERKRGRRRLENIWRQNIKFYNGEQQIGVDYGWQIDEVFNHIGPIVENRLGILAEIKPEIKNEVVRKILDRIHFNKTIEIGNFWQEVTGSVFYKVILKDCDISVVACSPFEIYPDKLDVGDMNEVKSVIHAKNVDGRLRIEKWDRKNLTIIGEHLNSKKQKDFEILYRGKIPFEFPFIRGTSEIMAGHFFGKSVVERAIPVQKAYNAIKNRKQEFINRLACGILIVEDGSTDIDSLETTGLCPGKIIVYKEGTKTPEFMPQSSMPECLAREEEKLLDEFSMITSGGDIITKVAGRANIGEGTLSILSEQMRLRLRRPIQSIENIYKEVEEKIIVNLSIKGDK
ncbi:MAG: hypothetical protein LBH47_01390 [Christensenellaceae bacterium]|nr:hypothetical protein [Christensenellaceae bacterium]